MKLLPALILTLAAGMLAGYAEARIPRSRVAIDQFRHTHPCPATGATRGACPGWQIDHIEPLCAGGLDAPSNMHWLTVTDHAAKTRIDVPRCRLMRQAAQASGQ